MPSRLLAGAALLGFRLVRCQGLSHLGQGVCFPGAKLQSGTSLRGWCGQVRCFASRRGGCLR